MTDDGRLSGSVADDGIETAATDGSGFHVPRWREPPQP